MPNPIYPGADWHPGAFAGYVRGKTRMRLVKAHYTVGRDSTGIGLRGYFQFLVGRDGYIQQFAEADAVCWDSGEFNQTGPGIEIEYYPDSDGDAIFTDAARASCSKLIHWLHTEWGVPLDYYDGERIPVTERLDGFISHRSLEQRERHYDYWPQADWDAMVGGPPDRPPTLPAEGESMITIGWNPERKTLVAMAPNGVGQIFFSEQNSRGEWSPWTEVAQGSFAMPVRQLG